MTSSESVASARTLLFVPGDRPDRFAKAAASGADGVVIDLEDAVAPEVKEAARENARRWLADGHTALVRVNGTGTAWHDGDIAALADHPVGVLLPKAASAALVAEVVARLADGSCVIPMFETAAGVASATAICAVPGVVRAAFGHVDLATELGIDHTDWNALAYARSAIVLASAAAGISPPLDGVTIAFADDKPVTADTRQAAAFGFTGKLCIHPRQIQPVHAVFAPSDAEIRWARSIIASAEKGAVTALDGKMIDKPLIDQARRLLSRSGHGQD